MFMSSMSSMSSLDSASSLIHSYGCVLDDSSGRMLANSLGGEYNPSHNATTLRMCYCLSGDKVAYDMLCSLPHTHTIDLVSVRCG